MSESRAWAYLSRVAEPPCADLAQLVTRVGPVEAAERVRRGAVGERLLRFTRARREIDCAKDDLDRLARLGGRLVTPDDPEWPTLAFVAFDGVDLVKHPDGLAPLALWVTGEAALDDVAARAAAVVGTRAATTYGEQVTADLAADLADRDVTVVSGGAYGIDGAGHRAALAADGRTVAVLASGVDVPYPSGHSALLHRIRTHGLVLSEYPPGTTPARHRFLIRNRLVAALAGCTVVVEAGLRSGAANTASWARALGRTVCAVPGPVTSSASAGCHNLIRAGALLVTRADEVVEMVGSIGELADEPQHPDTPFDGLSDTEKLVYEALPARGSRTVGQLAVESGLPATRVPGELAMLELAGLAEQRDGRWRMTGRPKS
ncbi:MAG: DNA-processing protein DprA [Mycobacterium sp.]